MHGIKYLAAFIVLLFGTFVLQAQVYNPTVEVDPSAMPAITNLNNAVAYVSNNMFNASAQTNAPWTLTLNFVVASNNTNLILWSPRMVKSGKITNVVLEAVDGGVGVGDFVVRTNSGKAPSTWDYIAYTNIPVVGSTSSNKAITINYNANTFWSYTLTNGTISNLNVHVSGVE